jgi:hypothetical protein
MSNPTKNTLPKELASITPLGGFIPVEAIDPQPQCQMRILGMSIVTLWVLSIIVAISMALTNKRLTTSNFWGAGIGVSFLVGPFYFIQLVVGLGRGKYSTSSLSNVELLDQQIIKHIQGQLI